MIHHVKFIILSMIFVLLLSSCVPVQVVKESQYGENDPSNKIIIEENLEDREMIDGYRIKVASTESMEEANLLEKQIVNAVQEPVYIEFIVDKYMIYVGDCQNKEEANTLKERLRMNGFTKIYSVPKRVYKGVEERVIHTTEVADITVTETKVDEPKFEKFLGYRVQIGAFKDEDKARKLKDMVSKQVSDRVYVVLAEDNLHKVQIGDYSARIDADMMKETLITSYEYLGSFIQKSWIFIGDDSGMNLTGKFYIQIGAFATSENAKQFADNSIKPLGYKNSEIYNNEGLFKVLIGAYNSKEAAEVAKQKIVLDGFEGAWILEK
ncbi:MAG: SPOR domain-containing protein [Candidatus Delongbacteria bacterium]|jgi:cell division septation protein DedD|nr:SPOR domain-containing protein [Candidatus Delongbacteria bacterium]